MNRLEVLCEHWGRTREYTCRVLEQTDRARWFELVGRTSEHDGVTHIAWQVGHLAVAETALLWGRLLERDVASLDALPACFRHAFGGGSTPVADTSSYPSAEEILAVFDRVHQTITSELAGLDIAVLSEPPAEPHWAMQTREDALWWAIRHESLHVGQIGLCRRLLGQAPWR